MKAIPLVRNNLSEKLEDRSGTGGAALRCMDRAAKNICFFKLIYITFHHARL